MFEEVIGHARAKNRFSTELPSAVLLLGPRSVGRRTLAQAWARESGATLEGVVLGAETAREVVRKGTVSAFAMRAVFARLESATSASLNALLKVLEEPPPNMKFFLSSDGSHPSTVESRSEVIRFGLLTTEELQRVLRRIGARGDIEMAARRSDGTVAGALEAIEDEEHRGKVLRFLRALSMGDRDGARTAAATFDGDKTLDLLRHWTLEATSGVWRRFDSVEGYGLQHRPDVVDRIARAARTTNRPRLSARLVVEEVFREVR